MPQFSHNFSKYIYLPSGGLSYPPDAWLKPLTSELIYLYYDNFANTNFEYMLQILQEFTKLPIDIAELYTPDFYYLWYIIKSQEMINKSYEYKELNCSKCKTENKVLIDFTQFKIRMNNTNINMLKVVIDEYTFTIRLRKVKDNLRFPYQTLSNNNSINQFQQYCLQQVVNVKTDLYGEVERIYFNSIINSLSLQQILDLYNNIVEYNKIFGIYDNLEFICKKCGEINIYSLFNDLSNSNITMIMGSSDFDKKEHYKSLLSLLQMKLFSIENLMSVQYKNFGNFSDAMNEIELIPNGPMM